MQSQHATSDQINLLLKTYRNSQKFHTFKEQMELNSYSASLEERLFYALANSEDLQKYIQLIIAEEEEQNKTSVDSLPPNYFDLLPNEIAIQILPYLSTNRAELYAFGYTSKRMQELVRDFIQRSSVGFIYSQCVEDPLHFPKEFRTTAKYLEICEKLKNQQTLTNKEILIYTLTTDDMSRLAPHQLDAAILDFKHQVEKIEADIVANQITDPLTIGEYHWLNDMLLSLNISSLALKVTSIYKFINDIEERTKYFNAAKKIIFKEDLAINFKKELSNQFLMTYFEKKEILKIFEDEVFRGKHLVLDARFNSYAFLNGVLIYILDQELNFLIFNVKKNKLLPSFYCNLSGTNLSHANLSRLNLTGFNFCNAILNNVNMSFSTLAKNNFIEAQMDYVSLVSANMDEQILLFFLQHEKLYACNLLFKNEKNIYTINWFLHNMADICSQLSESLKDFSNINHSSFREFLAKNLIAFLRDKYFNGVTHENWDKTLSILKNIIATVKKSPIYPAQKRFFFSKDPNVDPGIQILEQGEKDLLQPRSQNNCKK